MSDSNQFQVDKLLEKVPGKYALALLLGRRAIQIKRADRDELYPLQRAYDEILKGEVSITYEAQESTTDPLSLDALVLEEEAPADAPVGSVQGGADVPPEGFSIEEGSEDGEAGLAALLGDDDDEDMDEDESDFDGEPDEDLESEE